MSSLTKPASRSFVLRPRSLAAAVLAISLVTVGIVPSQAHAKLKAAKEQKDPREMQAREAFAAGSYKEALDIYTKLYAEKLHPTYLRNIGRCYQNLNEPDRAISSFREYFRKAKSIPADERAEVEGYIKELEDLQRRNAAMAAKPAEPPAQPLPPAAPPADPIAPSPQPMLMVQQPGPQPESDPAPFYKRAWFWSVVGVVVVAGTVGGLWAGGAFSAPSKPGCAAGYDCR